MSSIFGIFKPSSDNSINVESLKRMSVWNNAYGEEIDKPLVLNNIAIGCFLEKLNKNLEMTPPVLETHEQVAVIDAIIYNRDEILCDINMQTNKHMSDEELLLLYISEFGFDYLKKVNGDFAGAVYDKKKNSITLFRDHMGVRPLFYYADKEFLAFSTDIRGLIAIHEVETKISEEWIYKILGGYFTNGLETTEFQNIYCAKPGSYISFQIDSQGIEKKISTYWTVGRRKIKLKTDIEYQKKLKQLIENAVKIRLEAVSGMIGAELSGGLDSGVIDILINRLGRECIYYSWSDSPEELEMVDNDERLIINDICEQEGISCNYGNLNLTEGTPFVKKFSKTGLKIDYDEMFAFRFAFPPYINTPTIAQTATDIQKLGASVVFTGHGGDEGVSHRCDPYEMFYYNEYYHYFRYMFSTTNGQKNRILKTLKKCYDNLIVDRKEYLSPFVGGFNAQGLMNERLKKKFSKDKMPILYFFFDPITYINEGGSRNRLDNVSLLGAYAGARYLIPFLDYRVIDFAVSIPRYQYLRGRKDRYIYREAFKDLMPDSLYRLRTKETTSLQNVKPSSNWFETFNEDRKFVISKLKRSEWKDYLDFNALEEFENAGEPSVEDKFKYKSMYYTLYMLALAQNVIDKVRS